MVYDHSQSLNPAALVASRHEYRSAVVGVVLALLAGCTPMQHRLQPYRDDALQGAELARRASEMCSQHRWMSVMPPHAFTTDGCSLWPDSTWVECCVEHDIAYWCGGSAADRRQADRHLSRCVAGNGPAGMGPIMYWGVRAAGTPWLPLPFRWGYGWQGIRGYERLE